MIGFVLLRDRKFWISLDALAHLNCGAEDISFYTIEEYQRLALEQMRKERGATS